MASQWGGALPPPPGIVPDFINPPSQRDGNIALHTVLLSIVTIFVFIRIYTRIWITKLSLGVEDYLCLTSYFLSVAFSALVGKSYTLGIGRHIWDTPAEWLPEALKYFSISTWVYLVLTACVKLTFLSFYHRLFSTHTKGEYFIDGAIIFITLLNTALFIATILICLPIERAWNTAVPGHCIDPVILPYLSGISSSATDIYVLILPLVFLWGLNMTTQRKIRVAAVFGLGILSVASSLVRLAKTPSLRTNPDATWALSNIIIWAALEVNIGIICSCFITLPAFFERHISLSARSLISRLFSSSSSSKETNSANPPTEASDSQWSKYKHLDDPESQNLVRYYPENNILQTNTFSVGELRGHDTPNAGNIVPWVGRTGDDQVHSIHVQVGSNIA